MRISRVKLLQFRRFTDLEIVDIPESARLVVLAGPNGCGKTSLFDAFQYWNRLIGGFPLRDKLEDYYEKVKNTGIKLRNRVSIETFHEVTNGRKGVLYIRSAYRNEAEFKTASLNRVDPAAKEMRFWRMIEADTTVSSNYHRLASQAFDGLFSHENKELTVGEYQDKVIGNIKNSINKLFSDLRLNDHGISLKSGTFLFDKGSANAFEYMNLSSGEKSAFDLMLDIIVKRDEFEDSIYCIDEPDIHINTKLQGDLLEELYSLIPEPSQLWIATHSIGMMRRARELGEKVPGTVIFLDLGGHDFDQKVVVKPSRPTRAFWEKILDVALADLANLVAPREIIICEGKPSGTNSAKNSQHDAIIYNTIFCDELPDVKFIAAGNANDVATDRLGFVAALPMVASGIAARRLIDRDDHAPVDVASMAKNRVTTLARRHIEAYLYDDEVLTQLCFSVGKGDQAAELLREKRDAIAASTSRGNPPDDIKSAAGEIFNCAKKRLGITKMGNNQMAFARATLAPLIKPGMKIYAELKKDIFGAECAL